MKQGWTYKRLGDVCDVINGLWKGKKPPYVKVGVIRNANFTKSFIDIINMKNGNSRRVILSLRNLVVVKNNLLVVQSFLNERMESSLSVILHQYCESKTKSLLIVNSYSIIFYSFTKGEIR